MSKTIQDLEQFMRKFTYNEITSCLEWNGSTSNGYGFTSFNGRKGSVHKIIYEITHNVILTGINNPIDHLCRNRKCANPSHLELVTQKENLYRGFTIAANNKSKTNCPNGHLYSGFDNRGYRICKICMKNATNKYKELICQN